MFAGLNNPPYICSVMSKKSTTTAAVQGTPAVSATPSVSEMMAQFQAMQSQMQTLMAAIAVKEQPATPPQAIAETPAKGKGRGKKLDLAGGIVPTGQIVVPAKPQTRAEGIAIWKAKKDAKPTEVVAVPAMFQITDRGFLLVGNVEKLQATIDANGLQKYFTFIKRKSVAGKVYDGFSFSIARVEMVKSVFGIK